MSTLSTATRNKLKEFGASDYLARSITKSLSPVGKQGRSNLYLVAEIIAAIDAYFQRRIRNSTKDCLHLIRAELLKIDAGITSEDALEKLAGEILDEHSEFEKSIAISKKREKEFYKTHGNWINQNLVKHNNIVTFKA
ncbi:MAG: hypothetical protein ACFE0I_03185 [Elainellaceae cyanobacterium]